MSFKSFADLKKNTSKKFEKLTKELEKLNTNSSFQKDDRFWQAQTDQAGNGYAIIRFLDSPKGEDTPFVRLYSHSFKGPQGQWYIENCLTTLGQTDPCVEHTNELWNSGVESDKKIAGERKRKLSYYSNIYVVKDPANPENEGKVFLFRYGKKIFDKITDVMNPAFEDEKPINPFDFWEGANFRLKIRKVEGYTNYDKSEFEEAGPLLTDDEELEKIWNQEHSLQELVAPDKFKSYDELKSKLDRVLGNAPVRQTEKTVAENDANNEEELPWDEPEEKAEKKPSSKKTIVEEDDDDSLDWFKALAEDD